jgi:hypothetical protein
MRRNKGAAKKPATTKTRVAKTARKAATATAKKVARKTAQAAVAQVVPAIKQAVKAEVKKAAKAAKPRKARVSRTSKRRSSLFGRGAPKMPGRPASRGSYVPWDKAPATRKVSYTRKSRPGWHAVGGQWRLFENKKGPKRRRHRKARRNAGLPRRGAGGRFLKRGTSRGFLANRKRRTTRKHRKGARRNVSGRFVKRHVKRGVKRTYRRNRKHVRRAGKWSLRKLFGFKRNTGAVSGVMGVADTAIGILKPAIATAAGFFLSRIAGTYVRNVTAQRSAMIRTVAPLGAHVGAALLAYYLPRKVDALKGLRAYADPAAIGAMMGLVETLLVQFGGTVVRTHIAPPSLGDSLDVYERALRGVGEGGWNDYNPSDDYLLATLADSDGMGEYIPEQLGEYIEEPMGTLGEYIPEPGSDGSELFESSSGIDTGIYGPGVGDMGIDVEEAVAGTAIEAEEGLANHIFGSAGGNGLFGLGADALTVPKVASKAKSLTLQNVRLGMRPIDAGKQAYETIKASEGVSNGSAALRAAVVAGVRDALQSCGCCKPQRPTMPRHTSYRPVAPMVTGPKQCREVCSSGPVTRPGLRLVGGAPQLTKSIGGGGVSGDDLGDDIGAGGNFGSMF